MTIKELKDFIIKARRSNPFTFLEVVNALYENLYDLREDLFKNGMTELYENGPQVVNRERPETKIYSTMIQRYSNVMKQLIDYMPEEKQKEENDELKEFLNRRKVKK